MKYGLWFCGTKDDAPDWLRDGTGAVRYCTSWDEVQCLRNYLYSGEEEIEIKEIMDGDRAQEGDTWKAE